MLSKIKIHHLSFYFLQGDKSLQRYKKLNSALVELVQDYSLVSFVPLNVEVLLKKKIVNLSFYTFCAHIFFCTRCLYSVNSHRKS